ncbi:zinc-dependent alcohol dehydrogenase family protein [Lentzea sp. NPDC092896]|uniref:zinc-dependent alcohol dehydrogenase family protein n=1 Tax=Lentzea sp. NPDC092896 TaxID=3364127 RepID=UPI00380EB503
MRAAVLEEFGRPVVLKEIDRPEPGPGRVLVRVAASGLNPLDVKIAAGQAGHAEVEPPAVLGLDLAGVVETAGEGFEAGDEVFGLTGGVGGLQGSLAEFAAVDARLLARKPAKLTMAEAAVLPLVAITAWEGLVDRARVRPGLKVLVHGGAGGIGQVAIQIARARGADVYATCSPGHADVVEKLGAVPIDRARSVEDYVAEHTGGEGFDIVFDTVGGEVLDASFRAARVYTGHVVSALGWGTHSIAPLSFRGATYSGVFTLLPMLTGQGRAHHGEILREVAALVDAGELRPSEPRTFGLDAVEKAFGEIGRGKVAVEIGG